MRELIQIMEVKAPTEAVPGTEVFIRVEVKALSVATTIWCIGVLDSETRFLDQTVVVYAGESYYFINSFIMPERDVEVNIFAYYYNITLGGMILDDSAKKIVKVSTLVPAFSEFKIADYRRV